MASSFLLAFLHIDSRCPLSDNLLSIITLISFRYLLGLIIVLSIFKDVSFLLLLKFIRWHFSSFSFI